MAIGMTPREFWHGELGLCRAYRESWAMKMDDADTRAWLDGYYTFQAVAASIAGAFGKSDATYPEHPAHEEGEAKRGPARADGAESGREPAGLAFMEVYAVQHNAAMKRKREMGKAATGSD